MNNAIAKKYLQLRRQPQNAIVVMLFKASLIPDRQEQPAARALPEGRPPSAVTVM